MQQIIPNRYVGLQFYGKIFKILEHTRTHTHTQNKYTQTQSEYVKKQTLRIIIFFFFFFSSRVCFLVLSQLLKTLGILMVNTGPNVANYTNHKSSKINGIKEEKTAR